MMNTEQVFVFYFTEKCLMKEKHSADGILFCGEGLWTGEKYGKKREGVSLY